MPAVGFGCWKLGKDIAADTSKEIRLICLIVFNSTLSVALPQLSFNNLVLQTRIRVWSCIPDAADPIQPFSLENLYTVVVKFCKWSNFESVLK
jgi:hypothetical protein